MRFKKRFGGRFKKRFRHRFRKPFRSFRPRFRRFRSGGGFGLPKIAIIAILAVVAFKYTPLKKWINGGNS